VGGWASGGGWNTGGAFGDRIVFHGGVDNQQTLAYGSPEDVRQEVLYNLDVLGAGGGYILAPCHNIQAISPPENVVAMYETALSGQYSGMGSER
jgi:uroporphyrinogen decarboxylase